MDRDDLLKMIDAFDDGTLKVDVDGVIHPDDDGGYDLKDVEAALHDLEADIDNMRKVIAWAKLAPKYQEPQQ